MKDQLIAIVILWGMALGLFWIRHFVLTVAKRKSNAAAMSADDDRRSNVFAGDEPRFIAGLTTADPVGTLKAGFGVVYAGNGHGDSPDDCWHKENVSRTN